MSKRYLPNKSRYILKGFKYKLKALFAGCPLLLLRVAY